MREPNIVNMNLYRRKEFHNPLFNALTNELDNIVLEKGLPDEVKSACSVIMRIPGTGLMDSLNVAQAASVFMHRVFEL